MANFAFLDSAFLGPPSQGGVVHRDRTDADDVDAIRWSMSRAGTLTAALNYYRALFTPEGMSFAKDRSLAGTRTRPLPMPVLQIWGRNDVFLGEELVRGTEKYCTDFTLELIEDCSHWAQQDRPDEVIGKIRGWLAQKQAVPVPVGHAR